MAAISRQKSHDELEQHKSEALNKVENYLNSLISSNNPRLNGKADKLSYWLEDYIKFLTFEQNFSPTSLRRYKRGEIVKAHLGYNIGSEEGGLHYAIILDKENSIHNPVVTIIPLTSVKPNKDTSLLRKGEIFLGNELFVNLNSKLLLYRKNIIAELNETKKIIANLDEPLFLSLSKELTDKINDMEQNLDFIGRIEKEVNKMKKGSIALVNQITTISKIRIYDPKTNQDVLSGIKLSNEKLDTIDKELLKLYTK